MSPKERAASGGFGGRSGRMSGREKPATADLEEEKLSQPCLEANTDGSWREVDILDDRGGMYLVRYVECEDEEEFISIARLRLRARRCDDWDCGILRRGIDVSVLCVNPEEQHVDPRRAAKSLYDAKIVSVLKSKHILDCSCKFFVQFYDTKADLEDEKLVRRLLRNIPEKEVDISMLRVLQQPGIIPLHEVLRANMSQKWEEEQGRWSVDAYFLKEAKLKVFVISGEGEGSQISPRDDRSLEGLTNPGGRLGTGWQSGASKAQKPPVLDPTTRLGTGRVAAGQKHQAREVLEVNHHRGKKSSPTTNLMFPDRGVKRKHESVEEKETSNVLQEDYSPGVSSRLAHRFEDMAGSGASRRRERNVGQHLTSGYETRDKSGRPVDPKRGRRLTSVDSESSGQPDGNPSDSSEDVLLYSGHTSERVRNFDMIFKRGRLEKEQPPAGKAQGYNENGTSGYGLQKASEKVFEGKGHGTRRPGKSPDDTARHWQVDDTDPDLGRYPKQRAEKRSLSGEDRGLDKSPEEENTGRRRGRPRGRARSKNAGGYEWIERESVQAMKENVGRSKQTKETERRDMGAVPNAKFESPNNVTASSSRSQEIETGRDMSTRSETRSKQGKLPERVMTKRSSERLQKISPVMPAPKKKGLGKVDNDSPGLAKADVYSSSSPNSEDIESENEPGPQLRKLRPRIHLNSKKKSLPSKSNKQRDAQKEDKSATEKVVIRPLYIDLLENNSKDDESERQCSPKNKEVRHDSGVKDTWDPIIEVDLSDSDCNIIDERPPLVQKVWAEFDGATAEQVLSLSREESAKAEVCQGDDDTQEIECEHKLCFKDDVGFVCSICGIVTTPVEDVVPHVEIPQRRPRGADLDEWDFDNSPDVNLEAFQYNQVKNGEVGSMLDISLPSHYAKQMHPHQKEGFEFLWRNLGCDSEGNLIDKKADRNAGCVLSHAPGTGKSFLVISFLKSYMERFPKCQPLIVVPKIMLLRWQKEFQRWKSGIKVYILNTAPEVGKSLVEWHIETGVINLPNCQISPKLWNDACRMSILYEWTRGRSVCLVSYNLFSSLTDEEGSSRTMEGETVRKSLLESPGILILDEGHFPRNKDTRIRKALMKVKTNARILLSGTLFQNNFEELFNTLYLVRPGFVESFSSCDLGLSSDVLGRDIDKELAADHLAMEAVTEAAEKKARKLFVEEIGMKIEEGQLCRGSEVLQHGLQMLQRLTADFVHHHTGEVLASLPGLRDFGILLKPTTLQCSLLEVVDKRFQRPDEYLKREIAVSETSIHPKLLTKLEFFRGVPILSSLEQSAVLKKEPSDPQDGVKTKFVYDLLSTLDTSNEKVLIFSQHISPLELLEDMLKATFNWDKNKVLRLDGTMAMNDREAVIEEFNKPSSQAKVLLASTKACGEGINLVGASRVIFLDVLWNPAVIKQAISRAFRLGQKKIVYVYRLIAFGTIEEKKYKKAIRKDWLSMSIFSPVAGETDVQADSSTDLPESDKKESWGEEIRAWEVDANTCEDSLLEKLLQKDKSQANSFLKVVEHGSQFHNRKTACGPDARDWFLEDWDYKDLSHTQETREDGVLGVENTNPEILASKLYQDFGEIGAFDAGADCSSDTDDEIACDGD